MKLIQVKSWNIERGNDICAAMLMGSFTRYLYRELDDPDIDPCLSGRIDTGFDRLHGGCLFLSFTAMAVLEALIDWDRWQEEGGGVFAYENLEADDDKPYTAAPDLAAFLLREIPEASWYQIAENWMVPDDTELKELLVRWARAVKLPLMGDPVTADDDEEEGDGESAIAPLVLVQPGLRVHVDTSHNLPYDYEDFGMDLDELKAKYVAEQEHPEYTNAQWATQAHDQPYWEWVAAKVRADRDEFEAEPDAE